MQFDSYHPNDQPDAVRVAAGGQAPVVVAEITTDVSGVTDHSMLLGPDELEACDAAIDRLIEATEAGVECLGLRWPAA